RLDEKGRGILLLHDIHPATVMALPTILKELKERGYHVVQVVPTGERPASLPELVASPASDKEAWPRIVKTSAASDKPARHHRIKKLAIGKHRRAKIAGVPATDYVTQGREWPLRQF
ncbi:MAG: hypothetical protein ACREB2_13400, partial [Pseudolabrys sp.]